MGRIKVLIADDAAFMRETFKRYLDPNKFEVFLATNGIEAVELYKEHRPHVVSLDITMPEMSGKDALKAIKEFDKGANVMMCTALGQEESVKECVRFGCSNYLVKPFTEEVYLEKINGMIKRGVIARRCAYDVKNCNDCTYADVCRVDK